MENNLKVKIKIQAYERGILPSKLSQLQNDVPYATQEWVAQNFQELGEGFGPRLDGGVVGNPYSGGVLSFDGRDVTDPASAGISFDGGVISIL